MENESNGANFAKLKRTGITVIAQFENGGEVRIEDGSDGTWYVFDCDCLDALPFCRAQCCALLGTTIFEEDIDLFKEKLGEEITNRIIDFDPRFDEYVMKRFSDGRCSCLDRETKQCQIYDNRPTTCRKFHCSRGAEMRGWKLANAVNRQCSH